MAEIDQSYDGRTSILVVDDDPILCQMLSLLLSQAGFHVITAFDGREALELLGQERVEGILLDVMMPDMDGFEVCRRVKGDPVTAHIPVMLVTALTDQKHRQKGAEAGADDFIKKPVDGPRLLETVRRRVIDDR